MAEEKVAKCFVVLSRLPNRIYNEEEAIAKMNADIVQVKNSEVYLLELKKVKKKVVKEDFVDVEVEDREPTIGEQGQNPAQPVEMAELDRAHERVRNAAARVFRVQPVVRGGEPEEVDPPVDDGDIDDRG